MSKDLKKSGFRWRVHHFILYLISEGDGTYWAYVVPLSDGGGSLIDLDFLVPPEYGVSESNPYTRQQVIKLSRLAGYNNKQIEAAFMLADVFDLADHHDLAQMGDEDYERLLRNAKRRLVYRRKRAHELKNRNAPNN